MNCPNCLFSNQKITKFCNKCNYNISKQLSTINSFDAIFGTMIYPLRSKINLRQHSNYASINTRTSINVSFNHSGFHSRILHRGDPIRIMSWNIRYAGGRKHFFYEGGSTVRVPIKDMLQTLLSIAKIIWRYNPDIVLLQEVDRNSARTGGIDQHDWLAKKLGYPWTISTPYHKVPYIPYPHYEHVGRVDMHLSIFSKFSLTSGWRYQLPDLIKPIWLQIFNLQHALLEVQIPFEGGSLNLYNTHLSAFSYGDGTLDRQVAVIRKILQPALQIGKPIFLAGDFNALPPWDNPKRLGADASYYQDISPPIIPLMNYLYTPLTERIWRNAPNRWGTYLPYGTTHADRTIDWTFTGGPIETLNFTIISDIENASDHCPLLQTIRIKI